jgi:signal peptidase I
MKHTGRTLTFFFIVVLAALVIKLFALDVLYVSGPSMLPTLTHGSIVVEFKLAWGIPLPFTNRYLIRWGWPQQEDIVIYPRDGRYVIKRCVASGGAPLHWSGDYCLRIGDRTVPLSEIQYGNLSGITAVPQNMIFALGDNPEHSVDSRDYGFIDQDSVRGKVIWP